MTEYNSQPIYLLNPSENTPEIRDATDSFLDQWLDRHSLSARSQLYHYTTLSGIQGILKNRAIWCGHSGTLNDPLEIQYGKEIIGNILTKVMSENDREDLRMFLHHLINQVRVFGEGMFHAFVACFCESGNLLSQWRGYGSDGGGYCLGLEFSSNTYIANDLNNVTEGQRPRLRKIIYGEEEQRSLVQQYVDNVIAAATNTFDGRMPTTPTETSPLAAMMAMQASNLLLDMLLSFKHPAFAEEKEWRLVLVTDESHQPENLQFRETSAGLIPYRPTYIYDKTDSNQLQFPITYVGFGPMLEPLRTKSAIELFLYNTATDSHDIKLIPQQVEIKGAGYIIR